MTTTTTSERTYWQTLVIFSGLMLGMLLAALDATVVTTALPTITGELGGIGKLSWVVTAYLLASTVSTPVYGKLGDLYGRKRLFQIAIGIFFAGSALCGLAQDMNQLIAFRALQGLGGGGLIVLAQAIIGELVSPRERGRYAGWFGAVFGASSIGGPLLGGFITDNTSWRWVFYVNLPLCAVALLVTALVVPRSPHHGNPKVDYLGTALLTAGITCLVLLTTWGGSEHAWGSPLIVGLGAGAAASLGALAVVERRAPEPVVPLPLFRTRTFTVASAVSFIIGMAMFGATSFLPLFLQVVKGASATSSGLLLLPLTLGLLAASLGSGQLISRTGRYRVFPIAGCMSATLALYLLSTMDSATSRPAITAFMAVLGVGIGLTMQPLILAAQNAVGFAELGVATSTVSFFRSLGGSVGVALFGAVFNNLLATRLGRAFTVGEGATFTPETVQALPAAERLAFTAAFSDALTTVFLWATPIAALGIALALALREVPLRSSAPTTSHAGELAVGSAAGTADPSVASGALH